MLKHNPPLSHEDAGTDAEQQETGGDVGATEGQMGASAAEGSPSELEKLRNEAAAERSKASEDRDRMLRIAAEFENAKKRWDRERLEVRQYSIQEFARDLLPVIDAFDKAMSAIEQSSPALDTDEGKKVAAIVEGVQIVSKVFQDSVRKHGIERLPGVGQPFNPAFHNAVARVVDASLEHDVVADEFVPGYKIGDRVLRTAMVRVGTPHE